MAERLQVSAAFLSKVESGKSKPPAKWKQEIVSLYCLDEEQREELCKYIDEARMSISVDISTLNADDRMLIQAFAKQLKTMSISDKERWKEILMEQYFT